VTDFYDIPLETLDGSTTTMGYYRGKMLLIVNVASQCGFTPQYKGLETLYRKFKESGFVVLGFPCNQFGRQEPASETDIRRFCDVQFGVTFPMFSKIEVNGPNTHALYRYLKSKKRGFLGRQAIAWNFTKFLTDRNGHVVERYGPRTKPESIERDVARLV
jgi:glutathione peroxidase